MPNTPSYVVDLARRLRQRQTPYEDALLACLGGRKLGGAKFRRQHPIGRYILDFYCHEAGLAVELEGGIHNPKGRREYDAVRREVIEQLGIRLLVFNNEEISQDPESVLVQILEALTSGNSRPHPRPISHEES